MGAFVARLTVRETFTDRELRILCAFAVAKDMEPSRLIRDFHLALGLPPDLRTFAEVMAWTGVVPATQGNGVDLDEDNVEYLRRLVAVIPLTVDADEELRRSASYVQDRILRLEERMRRRRHLVDGVFAALDRICE
jgi:hypothetical protein